MKSLKVQQIFPIFLYFLHIKLFVCQSQISDTNLLPLLQQPLSTSSPPSSSVPPVHKYGYAASYAWKFRFPISYSTKIQDTVPATTTTTGQWRPIQYYSQEQVQLPNEYLISSNYPAGPVQIQGQAPTDSRGVSRQQIFTGAEGQPQSLGISQQQPTGTVLQELPAYNQIPQSPQTLIYQYTEGQTPQSLYFSQRAPQTGQELLSQNQIQARPQSLIYQYPKGQPPQSLHFSQQPTQTGMKLPTQNQIRVRPQPLMHQYPEQRPTQPGQELTTQDQIRQQLLAQGQQSQFLDTNGQQLSIGTEGLGQAIGSASISGIRPQLTEPSVGSGAQEQKQQTFGKVPKALQVPIVDEQGQQVGWDYYPYPDEDEERSQQTPVMQKIDQQPIWSTTNGQTRLRGSQIPQTSIPSQQQFPQQIISHPPIQQFAQQQHHSTLPLQETQRLHITPTLQTQQQQIQQPATFTPQGQHITPFSTDKTQFLQRQPFSTDQAQFLQRQPTNQQIQPRFGGQQLYSTPPSQQDGTTSPDLQEMSKMLHSFQQNMLQSLLSGLHQTALGAQPTSSSSSQFDTNNPVAMAGATITDYPSGHSNMNSFTYTNA